MKKEKNLIYLKLLDDTIKKYNNKNIVIEINAKYFISWQKNPY